MKQYRWTWGFCGFGRAHRLGRLIVQPDRGEPMRVYTYRYYNLGIAQLRFKERLPVVGCGPVE